MSRQLEKAVEERQAKRATAILAAVEYGLVQGVGHAGGEFLGFSITDRGSDWLMVIKAVVGGSRQVAFVGAGDLGAVLIKATRLAGADGLSWREDKYQGK